MTSTDELLARLAQLRASIPDVDDRLIGALCVAAPATVAAVLTRMEGSV